MNAINYKKNKEMGKKMITDNNFLTKQEQEEVYNIILFYVLIIFSLNIF